MRRRLARYGLWLLTGAVPVFIAACYGVVRTYNRYGRVIDAQTRAGIPGIRVTCVAPSSSVVTTDADGAFVLPIEDGVACPQVRAEDVDGADNGGPYQTTEVATPAAGDILLELSP